MAAQWAHKFYNSKLWKDTRRIVLARDHYTCRDCHCRAAEVHHIDPLTPDNIGDVAIALNPDNLACLCHDCHDKITKGFTGDLDGEYVFDDNGQVIASPLTLIGINGN